MTPEQLPPRADALAHNALADLLRDGCTPPEKPVVRSAISKRASLRVVLTVTRWDGPAQIDAETLNRIRDFGRPRYEPATLTPTQRRILQICKPNKPLSGKKIASELDKDYSPYVRNLLSKLFKAGYLAKVQGGYVLSRPV